MARDDQAGAVAAATYFLIELYPYTIASQDTVPWIAMSHQDCKFCASAVRTATGLHDSDLIVLVAPLRASHISFETVSPVAFSVFFDVETGPDRTYTMDGALTEETSIASGKASVAVVRQGLKWIVLGVDLQETNP